MNEPIQFEAIRVQAILAGHAGVGGAMLPILHDLQATFGCVPDAALPLIAGALNLSRAEVHGVVSFYHEYRRLPSGRHVLKLCQAEACQAMGARSLAAHVQDRLNVKLGETTADRRVTVEAIYCLGLCATAPSAMLDGKLMGRASAAKLDRALEALA